MDKPRVSDADIVLGLKMVEEEFDEESVAARWLTRALLDLKDARTQLKDCHAILHDMHARMVDVYDGAEGSRNELPFSGSDIRDIWEVLQ